MTPELQEALPWPSPVSLQNPNRLLCELRAGWEQLLPQAGLSLQLQELGVGSAKVGSTLNQFGAGAQLPAEPCRVAVVSLGVPPLGDKGQLEVAEGEQEPFPHPVQAVPALQGSLKGGTLLTTQPHPHSPSPTQDVSS